MKYLNQKQTLKHLTASLLGSTMFFAAPAFAADNTPAGEADVKASVEVSVNDEATKQLEAKRKKLLKRAVEAVSETDKAIAAIDGDEAEEALEALARAKGELDIILAREPSLALAPVDVSTTRLDTLASVDDVKKLRKDIKALVKDGELQAARLLMRDFGSEVRTSVTNLPLATYSQALTAAAALIDDGDLDSARAVLKTALGTFVIHDVIAPMPLIRAQSMLDMSEKYLKGEVETDGEAVSDAERLEAAQVFRTNAAYQIELAKAFGYGDKRLYKALEADLDRLKKQVDNKGETSGLFNSLRRQINALSDSNEAS